jgi:hypothetical protein
MKLTEKYIKKYLANFHYELTREQLEQDWEFDKDPYYKEKDCWCFHAKDGSWLEIDNRDIKDAFKDVTSPLPLTMTPNCDFQSSWKEKSLEKIGKEDYKESSYCAGVEHEKKVAIEACQKVIDKFYDSNFDPTIDYMKIFKENL